MDNSLPLSSQIATLAIQIAVIIFAAKIFGRLAEKVKIPSVLGELSAGIIIGPYLLGGIAIPLTVFEHGLFPTVGNSNLPVSEMLYAFSVFGSIVLLFISGLETDIKQFLRYSTVGSMVGITGALFSFASGAFFGMKMFEVPLSDPRCLFLGILCTATSVGITARILTEKKRIDSPEGTTILAAAVLDDVLGIIGLAVVVGVIGMESDGLVKSSAWGPIGRIALKSIAIWLGFTAVGIIFSEKIADFLKKFQPANTFSVLAFGMALLLAGIFEHAGLAMIVGAYVMGLSLSKSGISNAILRNTAPLYNFFVPVFFVVMGMMTDIKIFVDMQVILYGIVYSVLAVIAKLAGCALAAYFMEFNLIGSLRIGAGMIPRGEVALIIASIGTGTIVTLNGVKTPVFTPELFGIAVIMTVLTTILSPLLLNLLLEVKKSGLRNEKSNDEKICTSYSMPSDNLREIIFQMMLDKFHKAGFKHSLQLQNGGTTFFSNGQIAFILEKSDDKLVFKANSFNTEIIRCIMTQVFKDLRTNIHYLKIL